jgi:hypothetical protein
VSVKAASRRSRDLIGDTPTESPSTSIFAPNMRRLYKFLRTGIRHPFPNKERPDIGPGVAGPNPRTRTGGATAGGTFYSVLVVAYPNERDLQLQTRRLLCKAST